MRTIISLALVLGFCRLCSAQDGFSASTTTNSGLKISLESRLEPAKPSLSGHYQMGVVGGDDESSRYAANSATHEYFGYTIQAEAIVNQPGKYRVTFSALRKTAKDLQLPDPAIWTMLPTPTSPAPEIVSSSDTIVLNVFENAATGQKIVDYIHVGQDTCAKGSDIACLKSTLAAAKGALNERVKQIQSAGDPVKVAAVLDSQRSWEKYRDDACGSIADEQRRLQCELKLTQSRERDLGSIY